MKFQTYTEQVPLNTVNAEIKGTAMPKGFDAGAGMAALAKGIGVINAGIEQRNENDDKLTLMAYMSDLEKARYEKLHNQENGYLNRYNDGAFGAAEAYQKDMKDTTDQLMKQYKFKTTKYKTAAMDLSNKSTLQGYEQVSNWEGKQKQAFEFKKLDDYIDTAALNASAFPNDLRNVLDKVSLMASMIASPDKYGEEGSKMAIRQAQAKVVGAAVNKLLENDDYAGAGAILQDSGDVLDYKTKTAYEKVINARQKANVQLQTDEDVYAKYGENVEAGVAAITQNSKLNAASGMEYARKSIGSQRGENQCANFVSDVINSMGGDPSLTSPLADGMYRKAEAKGLTFTDRRQLRDGDVVYWFTGGGFTPSDDPNDVNRSTKAYKGITHVGVYDAKTGKVIQSGTSGVKEVDLDYRKVVGFSHVAGQEMDEVAKQKRANEYRTFANAKIAQQRQQMNHNAELAANKMLAMYDAGVRDPQKFTDIVKEVSNGDFKVRQYLEGVAKSFGAVAANGKAGKALSADEKARLYQIMRDGKAFDGDYARGLAFVSANFDGNPAAIKAYADLYEQQKNLKGPFAYDMKGIVKAAIGKVPEGAAGLAIERAAEKAAINYVFDYRNTHEGKDPSATDVVNHVQKGMQAVNWGEYTTNPKAWIGKTSPLMIEPNDLELAGIRLVTQSTVGDTFTVYFRDGHVEPMTGDMIKQRVNEAK